MQWFGDLVTCDYWGELWLNEGFATYFENYGATAARPEYRFFDTFYATQTSLGQLLDAKNVSTHALATTSGQWMFCFFQGLVLYGGNCYRAAVRCQERLHVCLYRDFRSL